VPEDDNDLDLDDDDEMEDPALDEYEEPEVEEPVRKAKPKPKPRKPAPAPVAEEDDSNAEMARLGLDALKNAWATEAKAQYPAADYSTIGLKGVDDAGKAAFIDEARASHEKRVEELKNLGFVFQPGASEVEQREAELATAWGPSGPGAIQFDDAESKKMMEDELLSGDTMGVIGTMLSKGGLGEFFVKGHRR
jgi:hypothetical protein